MNYRHAYHAGNFADVMKHAILAHILVYLMRKPARLRFIDTHAGIGSYDLAGPDANRTGEWRDGIGRLAAASPPAAVSALLEPYLSAVGPAGADGSWRSYPGSPAVAQWLLRPDDRMTLCELHPADATALKRLFGSDRRVSFRIGDGYAALKGLVPPPERRGLVLVDPPFEAPGEFDRLLAAIVGAYAKWPTGSYLLWYPLKDRAAVGRFANGLAVSGLRRVLQLHLLVGNPDAGPLAGCGLVVVNPPFTLEGEAGVLLPWLATTLARAEERTDWSVRWLAGE